MQTRQLIISGRVQGVGFRNYIEFKARQFHIKGWVRNRRDGSVEAMIQGTPENIEAMIVRAHRGPPQASVTSVTVNEGDGNYMEFVVRPAE
jgi:acylphosphatase